MTRNTQTKNSEFNKEVAAVHSSMLYKSLKETLHRYIKANGCVKENLTDMVADLFHLCDEFQMDQEDIVRIATEHYTAEVQGRE